ncbi:MAG: hypothetical protein QOI99_2109 [Actinomycetota bacterium]|nr:hypothetical protein [Actinomycetota bacterium]
MRIGEREAGMLLWRMGREIGDLVMARAAADESSAG